MRKAVFAQAFLASNALLSSGLFASNVALNAAVTLNGTFGTTAAAASTVTDGVFLPKDNPWQDGTVWWEEATSPGNTIVIDLSAPALIGGLIVQADDNDSYLLEYQDLAGTWSAAWLVPNFDVEPFGMQTRPNALDSSEQYLLPVPVEAKALRIKGNPSDGDGLFAVSEVQAFAVPEPATILALAPLTAQRRRK